MDTTTLELLAKGQKSLMLESYEEALTYFKMAADINPNYSVVHLWLGHAYQKLNKVDVALHEFEIAATLDDDDAEPYLGMVTIYKQIGDAKSENEALKKSIQKSKNSAARQLSLGYLAAKQKDYKGALEHYYYASEWQPNDRRAMSAIGHAALHLNENVEAREVLVNATSQPFAPAEDFYHLGVAEQRLNHKDAAIRAYCNALRLNRSLRQVYPHLISLELITGRWICAWRHFRDFVRFT